MITDNGWQSAPIIFQTFPTFHEFWAQVIMPGVYIEQIYTLCKSADALDLLNNAAQLSQHGYTGLEIREYVIQALARKAQKL